MQSRLLVLALTSALFAGTPVMAATVYVANEGAGSLIVIDEDAASTVALEVLPHNVDLDPRWQDAADCRHARWPGARPW